MAEKQVVDGEVAANRPTGPGDFEEFQDGAQAMIRKAPEPSSGAKKSYKVLYPIDNFVMEGMPVVTSAGTPLTDEQAKKLLPVAEASGVKIVEVD